MTAAARCAFPPRSPGASVSRGSYGRIPNGPQKLWVMDDTAVDGPLTRCAEDAAMHLDAVVGPHPLDPNSLPHPGRSYRDLLRDLPKGLRIAFSPDLGYAVVQRDVAEVVADATTVFQDLGHEVEWIEGGPPEPGRDWGLQGAFELLAKLEPLLPRTRGDLRQGLHRRRQGGRPHEPEPLGNDPGAARSAQPVVRRRLRSLRPAPHPHGAVRSAPGKRSVPTGNGGEAPAGGERGQLHHALQHVLAPRGHRPGRALRGRPPRGHADRGSKAPGRPGSPDRVGLRAGQALPGRVAGSVTVGLGPRGENRPKRTIFLVKWGWNLATSTP